MKNFIVTLAALGMLACGAAQTVSAPSSTAALHGRVSNPVNGTYVEKARIKIEGTTLETFTDADGFYRLANVPAGVVIVKTFSTGLPTQVDRVAVAAGQELRLDIMFSDRTANDAHPTDGAVVKLSEFVVGASREMEGAAIAIGAQRFAPNIKTVVSADEFGQIADGNAGEFMKFLPGVTMNYAGGTPREISLHGVPPNNVPVTVDGFSVASATGTNTGRQTAMDFISVNNLARVEVTYSPTPESQGSALAGSVDMIPRSSFGRSRPSSSLSAFIVMRDDARNFNKTPGPLADRTPKVHPGFDFSTIVPVNQNFGFTLSGGLSTLYSDLRQAENTWRGAGAVTNGAAFPGTTPDRPYLTSFTVRDMPKETSRYSFGVTLDYKFTPIDRVSLALHDADLSSIITSHELTFNITKVAAGFTPTSTQSLPGGGDLQLVSATNHRRNHTYTSILTWRHDGAVWKSETGLGLSESRFDTRDVDKGLFGNSTARRTGVTTRFDDIYYLRPGVIDVFDGASGNRLDPYNLNTYALSTVNSNTQHNFDRRWTGYANVRRDFSWAVPFALKTGVDVRTIERDIRSPTTTFTYVGRDGVASSNPSSGDDSAAPFLDDIFSTRTAPYGFPRIQWTDNERILETYRANPNQFRLNEDSAYRSGVNLSKYASEIVSASYVRGDLHLVDRRLKLVGGLRAEQTNVKAQGPLTDPTRNVQRTPSGTPIVGPNGQPLPITTDPAAISRLTFLDRGYRTEKEYLRLFPSINASFDLHENLIVRAAHYDSVGRPDLNQYSGGLTLPNTENPPGADNRIIVNNSGIKAWSAKSTTLRLEYYFSGVGEISIGGFQREFKNLFGGIAFAATPQFLELYGLEPSTYGGYSITTQYNVPGLVKMDGFDVNYRQALTSLNGYLRGIQVFANLTRQRATGANLGSFTGSNYIPFTANWGASVTREKFKVQGGWNYRGRQRRGLVSGVGIEPETYNWGSKRLYVDVQVDYYLGKKLALYANLRNIGDASEDFKIAGPSTPPQGQFNTRANNGALWTFGIRGGF